MRLRGPLLLAAVMGALSLAGGVALAAAGSLDATFGDGGKALTSFGPPIDNESANAVAVQPDGKILAAGIHQHSGGYDFALARYNPNGTLDGGFGGDGRVTTDFAGYGRANALVIRRDGKIVVAGHGVDSSFADFALARYNPNGTLDKTFGGGDGKVTTNFGERTYEEIYGLVLQPDGKLVAAGSTGRVSDTQLFHDDVALARYNPNGTLDSSFGGGDGKVTTDVGPGNDVATDLVLQSDGKLAAAGLSARRAGRYEPARFLLIRYRPDGTRDRTFGQGGIVTTGFGAVDSGAYGLVLQPDGRLVAAGYADRAGSVEQFALARYEADGDLDPSFGGGDGMVMTPMGSWGGYAYDLARQRDGKLVAAGSTSVFALARYNPNGTLDGTFGGDGRVFTSFRNGYEAALAVTVQRDGRVVAAGSSERVNFVTEVYEEDFALARYTAE